MMVVMIFVMIFIQTISIDAAQDVFTVVPSLIRVQNLRLPLFEHHVMQKPSTPCLGRWTGDSRSIAPQCFARK